MEKTIITSDGLKNALKNYSLEESIIEYIWNGFDAGANEIRIDEYKNQLGGTNYITIRDNGSGINRAELDNKFKTLFQSEKQVSELFKSEINIKGKKGVGRLSFYNTAEKVAWSTVYHNGTNNMQYNITVDNFDLTTFTPTVEKETNDETGTIVKIYYNRNTNIQNFINMFCVEYAWYLRVYKDKEIYINNIKLDYSYLLEESKQLKGSFEKINYEIEICVWSQKLSDEYSKYYYVDEFSNVKYKENTTLNNKGDSFYHSVFIKSNLFNHFLFDSNNYEKDLLGAKSKNSDEYKNLKTIFDDELYAFRKIFIRKYTSKFINDLKTAGHYPKYDKKNMIDKLKEEQLDDMISNLYYFEPKIFSHLSNIQKTTLVRLFDLIMNSGEVNNVFKIIGEIVDLSPEERNDLSILLEKTLLSNIIAMQKLVVDRLQAIKDLKMLVFDLKKYTNEINHLQKFIEMHYWIFGEQYHLVTAEEPNFEEALRRYLYVLRGEENPKGSIEIEHPDSKKQMDIFAVQQLISGDIKKAIVVELKRPNINLSQKELDQLKTYFGVIVKEDRFEANNIEWEFILVGNKYDDYIKYEIETNKNHGEKGLVRKTEKCKIYVKTWSEIFTELEINFNFLNEKLKIDHSKFIDNNSLQPNEIIEKQKAI